VLLGTTGTELGGSEWGRPPRTARGTSAAADLATAAALHAVTAGLVGDRVVAGVHDCSHGGIAVALAEMAVAGRRASTSSSAARSRASPSRRRGWCSRWLPRGWARSSTGPRAAGLAAAEIGEARGERLVARGAFDLTLAEAEIAWRGAIPTAMGARSPSES